MKSIPASAIKNYVNATPGGSVAADDVTAGDGNVLITTSSGTVEITATSSTDIVVDAPSGQSVDLQVNGTNVVEVAGGRVDVSQPLILTKAGVSLAPAAAHPAFSVGHVLAFEAGANGGLELADCDDTTSYLDAPFGVALETSAENNTNAIMVHTVHGGIVNVKIASSTLSKGQWLYLSTTAGVGTTTAPDRDWETVAPAGANTIAAPIKATPSNIEPTPRPAPVITGVILNTSRSLQGENNPDTSSLCIFCLPTVTR